MVVAYVDTVFLMQGELLYDKQALRDEPFRFASGDDLITVVSFLWLIYKYSSVKKDVEQR